MTAERTREEETTSSPLVRHGDDAEPEVGADLGQAVDGAGAVLAEGELLAHPQLAQTGLLLQPGHELLGRPTGELRGERDNYYLVNPRLR